MNESPGALRTLDYSVSVGRDGPRDIRVNNDDKSYIDDFVETIGTSYTADARAFRRDGFCRRRFSDEMIYTASRVCLPRAEN